MDIQARKRNKAFVCSVCALLAFIFSLVSCDNFNKPVRAYFDYYTNTAGILEFSVPESIGKYSGMDVIESNSDKEVYFYLRNPKNYQLNFSYAPGNEADNARVEFAPEQDPSNSSLAKIVMPQATLEEIEKSSGCNKNVSGRILINVADETGRPFDSFYLPLFVNSAPPRVKDAVVVRDASNFVVCFRVKKLSGTIHEKDTKDLYINGEHYVLNFSGNPFITDSDGNGSSLKLKTTTSQLFNLTAQNVSSSASDEDKFTYSNPESGYINLYYVTGVNPEGAGNNRTFTYTITLKDLYGFYSDATVSTTSEKLTPPNVEVTSSGTDYCTDDKTGKYELVISHDKKCFHNTSDGQTVESTMASSPSIIYEVYDNNDNLVVSGTKKAPVKIPLERGKYYVKSYAVHTGCVDSEYSQNCAVKANAFTVRRSRNYYVNAAGKDNNDGSSEHPCRTLMQCVDVIETVAQTEGNDGTYKIILQSDIPADADNTSGILVEFPHNGNIQHFYIEGNGHTLYDIPSRHITIDKKQDGSKLTINNLNISQGNVRLQAGILEYLSGKISDFKYDSDEIWTYSNIIDVVAGTLYLGSDDGIVTITGNTLHSEKHALEITQAGTCHIRKAVVYDNKIKNTQTQSNLFITSTIGLDFNTLIIDGNLTGSKIGVQTNIAPSTGKAITFTSNYGYNGGSNNGVPPGRYFIGDVYGVGYDSATGEACLAQNGGGFDVDINEKVSFELDSVYIPFNTSKLLTVAVTKKQTAGTEETNVDITHNCTDFNYRLCYGGHDIGLNYYTPTTTNKVTIKNNLRSGSYVLYVSCRYNGVYYSQEIDVFVRTVEELYVSENGDDSKNGKTTAQALKTFGHAMRLIQLSNSTSFFTIHISGSVMLGDITETDKTNVLNNQLVSLNLDSYGGSTAQIVSGTNTIINSTVRVPVQLENITIAGNSSSTVINLQSESENLILKGNSRITGRVQLANKGCIILDSTYTAAQTVDVIPYQNDTVSRLIIKGSTTAAKIAKFSSSSSYWGIDREGKLGAPFKSSPNAVGDIVLNSGKAIAYNYRGKLTLAQKTDAIAVIFYAGGNSELGNRVLGVGYNAFSNDTALNYLKNNYDSNLWFNNGALDWCSGYAEGFNDKVPALIDKVDGSTAYADFKTYLGDRFESDAPYYYAAFYWAYELYPYYYRTRLASYTSGWYLPTLKEFEALYPNLNTVNTALTAIGAEELSGQWYWTASLPASDGADGQQVMWYNLLENHSGWCHKNGAPNEKNWHISLAIRRFN
ncbi:MAG: hypothetical protein K6E69_03265 [Treponema sp.]|uniref:hypothetical protein n=1 Tax=Treponema sp. TaxID=166 RepID=UPI00298D6A7F|nr:hypothetical protein [Treponema sp.]MCR5386119.1 hypothetical protein [Treponema sp.]